MTEREYLRLYVLPEVKVIGARVVRGPDWNYGNQDGNLPGPGTVTHIDDDDGMFNNMCLIII